MPTEAQVQGLGPFAQWGFTLEQLDDDELLLMHEGELVDSFIQTGTTEARLQQECAKHLVIKHGWTRDEGKDEQCQ